MLNASSSRIRERGRTHPFGGITFRVPDGLYPPTEGMEVLATQAARRLPQGGTMLDLGCGVGTVAAFVAARRPDARVWGTDVDDRAVATAKATAEAYGLENTTFLVGSLYEPLEPGFHADVVCSTLPWEPPSNYPDGATPRAAYIDEDGVFGRMLLDAGRVTTSDSTLLVYAPSTFASTFAAARLRVEKALVMPGTDNRVWVTHGC